MSSTWGLCKDCKWWQIEPKAPVKILTMGLCIDDKMLKFNLRVSGNSGCNRFMEGKPAHAKGFERPTADGEADAVIGARQPNPFHREGRQSRRKSRESRRCGRHHGPRRDALRRGRINHTNGECAVGAIYP